MKDENLLREVGKLGFSLFEKQETQDVNKILYDVIMSNEIRLLEGFPVILINAMESGSFDYEKLVSKFKKINDKLTFVNFIELSLAVYKYQQLEFEGNNVLLRKLSEDEKKNLNTFLECLKKNRTFNISNYQFSPERIKNIFLNYSKKEEKNIREVARKQEELSLEYALSQIFPPKQKNLFKKKLRGTEMTKTEKEYFSRVIKKKIIALSNSELHDMAKKILVDK